MWLQIIYLTSSSSILINFKNGQNTPITVSLSTEQLLLQESLYVFLFNPKTTLWRYAIIISVLQMSNWRLENFGNYLVSSKARPKILWSKSLCILPLYTIDFCKNIHILAAYFLLTMHLSIEGRYSEEHNYENLTNTYISLNNSNINNS